MSRLFIGVVIVLCLSVVSIYLFIPANLDISKIAIANCNPDAAGRILIEGNEWQQSLMSKKQDGLPSITSIGDRLIYNNDTFQISKRLHNSLVINISGKKMKTISSLNVIPVSVDSVALQWTSEVNAGNNPITRINSYTQAVGVKQNMTDLLNRLTSFLNNKENVYGLKIEKTSTRDTFLIATKAVFPAYPTVENLYSMISTLQKYVAVKGAKQTNAPMVNVTKDEKSAFQVMVALPTNISLPDAGSVFFRRMVPGFFLTSEIKGGDFTVIRGIEKMHLYIMDAKKTSMAIPFQSLISDRSKEPDSSKWITRIYYPINF